MVVHSMGWEMGLSHTTIRRIWSAFGLQPHRVENFRPSSDPLFVDKVRDIVGLYLLPPDRALVLCIADADGGSVQCLLHETVHVVF